MDGIIKTFPSGLVKLYTLDGAANDVDIVLRPPDGKIWLLLEAVGYHDDTGEDVMLTWAVTDGTITLAYPGAEFGVTGRQRFPFSTATFGGTFLLNYHVYATFTADSLTAGKKLYIRAWVIEIDE